MTKASMTATSLPSEQSDPLQSPAPGSWLPDPESWLRAIRDRLSMIFHQAVKNTESLETWWASHPLVRRHADEIGSPTDGAFLLQETEAFWDGIESRFSECAGCRAETAQPACVASAGRLRPGYTVELQVEGGAPREALDRCGRYDEAMGRERLIRLGVPRLLASTPLHELESSPSPRLLAASEALIQSLRRERQPSLELLIEGRLARRYAVVLFRAALLAHPSTESRWMPIGLLQRELKQRMTAKEPSLIPELIESDLLVLDGVDDDALRAEWFRKELVGLYDERREADRPTVIASLTRAKDVFRGVSVLLAGGTDDG